MIIRPFGSSRGACWRRQVSQSSARRADGAAALEAARALHPAAVLLDVLLPDRSGFEVAEELAETRDAPTVVLTSSRSARDLGMALDAAPARGFIPKAGFTGAAFAEVLGRP